MMVAVLVICYVLVLRYLDQKNREKDRLKTGAAPPGPADYTTIRESVQQLSARLSDMEVQYRELAKRLGATR